MRWRQGIGGITYQVEEKYRDKTCAGHHTDMSTEGHRHRIFNREAASDDPQYCGNSAALTSSNTSTINLLSVKIHKRLPSTNSLLIVYVDQHNSTVKI